MKDDCCGMKGFISQHGGRDVTLLNERLLATPRIQFPVDRYKLERMNQSALHTIVD